MRYVYIYVPLWKKSTLPTTLFNKKSFYLDLQQVKRANYLWNNSQSKKIWQSLRPWGKHGVLYTLTSPSLSLSYFLSLSPLPPPQFPSPNHIWRWSVTPIHNTCHNLCHWYFHIFLCIDTSLIQPWLPLLSPLGGVGGGCGDQLNW